MKKIFLINNFLGIITPIDELVIADFFGMSKLLFFKSKNPYKFDD